VPTGFGGHGGPPYFKNMESKFEFHTFTQRFVLVLVLVLEAFEPVSLSRTSTRTRTRTN